MIRVQPEDADYLARTSETGMGFQILELRVARHGARVFLALNSELLLPADTAESLMAELDELGKGGRPSYTEVLAAHEPRPLTEVIPMSEEHTRDIIEGSRRRIIKRLAASRLNPNVQTSPILRALLPSQPLSIEPAVDDVALYMRYSPYPNDRRVNSRGGFTRGTYATTYRDSALVPSGFAAVGRYALPSPLSARNLYTLVTADRPTRMATTVPAFGQAGGGVEAFFAHGAKRAMNRAHLIAEG